MATYYCKHCGQHFSSVTALSNQPCPRHPNGAYRGRHVLYEGGEKETYTCKHCGQRFRSISAMSVQPCPRHPNGSYKGKHSPAL